MSKPTTDEYECLTCEPTAPPEYRATLNTYGAIMHKEAGHIVRPVALNQRGGSK